MMKKTTSFFLVILLVFNFYSFPTLYAEAAMIGNEDTILPNSYVHTIYTEINSSSYTKVEKSGNYAWSNKIKIEYLADTDGPGRIVTFKVVEHLFLNDEDNITVFDLEENGTPKTITIRTGNNFTVYAKFKDSSSGTGEIKTRVSLYRDV